MRPSSSSASAGRSWSGLTGAFLWASKFEGGRTASALLHLSHSTQGPDISDAALISYLLASSSPHPGPGHSASQPPCLLLPLTHVCLRTQPQAHTLINAHTSTRARPHATQLHAQGAAGLVGRHPHAAPRQPAAAVRAAAALCPAPGGQHLRHAGGHCDGQRAVPRAQGALVGQSRSCAPCRAHTGGYRMWWAACCALVGLLRTYAPC